MGARLTGHPVFPQSVLRDTLHGVTVLARREVTFKPLDSEPLLSTVYNVEICAVGIEYPLASGPATFTTEDLLEAVASQDDPAIVPPRVWLGHPDDDRFHAGRATPAGSAEPALGKIVNMRVEDEGMTLVGDISGVPTWLAKILASAYPSRSIEGFRDATTATGRNWRLVVTDLALLGVVWPGVSTLEDLQSLFSEEGPEDVEVKEVEPMTVAAAARISGQVDVDDVRRAFVAAVQDGQFAGDLEWPWIRAMLQDPNELIVDDDATGEIWRLPYEVKDKEITFGSIKKVHIEYVNASQKRDPSARALVVTHVHLKGRQVAASYTSREESLVGITQEVQSMTPEQLRASLGLPSDATDEQVASKISELRAAAEPTPSPDQVPASPEAPFHGPGSPPDAAPAPEAPTQADPEPREVGDPERITQPDRGNDNDIHAAMAVLQKAGLAAVPMQAWQGMQAQVGVLSKRHEEDEKVTRQQILATAVRDGKIYPHQQSYYAERLEDPATRQSFVHLLTADVAQGGLMAGLVPVEGRQYSTVDGGSVSAEAYDPSWFPEIQNRDAVGSSPITQEG